MKMIGSGLALPFARAWPKKPRQSAQWNRLTTLRDSNEAENGEPQLQKK
ncbi:MAG: hypothetical protein FWD21_02165 [Peptococcaceae bacterium]|nr:hypothetical protein [Peptococcaceae bacterium]